MLIIDRSKSTWQISVNLSSYFCTDIIDEFLKEESQECIEKEYLSRFGVGLSKDEFGFTKFNIDGYKWGMGYPVAKISDNLLKIPKEYAINVAITALFFLVVNSKIADKLSTFILELIQKEKPPRMIIYWLRAVDLDELKKVDLSLSMLAKLLDTPKANVCRWYKDFNEMEKNRAEKERNFIWNYEFQVYFYRFNLEDRDLKELQNIPFINGVYRKHHRRTKAEIKRDVKRK